MKLRTLTNPPFPHTEQQNWLHLRPSAGRVVTWVLSLPVSPVVGVSLAQASRKENRNSEGSKSKGNPSKVLSFRL